MKTVMCSQTGFCHGVQKTLNAAEQLLRGKIPCYSIGTLIHNNSVAKHFTDRGLKIIEKPSDAKPSAALVRAHGISDFLRKDFESNGFELKDATCANILKTKQLIKEAYANGRTIVVIGLEKHAETVCLAGNMKHDGTPIPVFVVQNADNALSFIREHRAEEKVSVFVQTTFEEKLYNDISDILRKHFISCVFENGLCPVCIARRRAALELAGATDAVVVVGGKKSQNTKSISAIIRETGKEVFEVETVKDIDKTMVEKIRVLKSVGICGGTSTPQEDLEAVRTFLEIIV